MNPVAPRLPVILGSLAGLVVAFISFLVQVSPAVCAMRALAAFMVFAAFGIVIRYLLADTAGQKDETTGDAASASQGPGLDGIEPGTSVADLLAEEEAQRAGETTRPPAET